MRGHRDRLPRGEGRGPGAAVRERARGALPAGRERARRRAPHRVGAGPHARGRGRGARGDLPRAAAPAARRPVAPARQCRRACWPCGRRRSRAAPRRSTRSAPTSRRCRSCKLWPKDGGRFLTFPLVLTEHPRDEGAQPRRLPHARLRPADHRHALADRQGRRLPLPRGREARRGARGRGRGGRRPRHAARQRRAAARGRGRAGVRGLPARRAHAARARDAAAHGRAGGRRVRHRGHRAGRRAPPRGPVRRPLRALLARRRLPGLPRAQRHAPRAARLPGERGRQASPGGQVHGRGGAGDVHRRAQGHPPRDPRPVGVLRGRLPQPAGGRGGEPLREGGEEDRARPDGHGAALAHQGHRAGGRRREPARPRRGVRRDRAQLRPGRGPDPACPACRSTRSTSPPSP